LAALLAWLQFVGGWHVAAQGGAVTDDQVNAVAKKLNCPACENAR
jgi:hypothetical protein